MTLRHDLSMLLISSIKSLLLYRRYSKLFVIIFISDLTIYSLERPSRTKTAQQCFVASVISYRRARYCDDSRSVTTYQQESTPLTFHITMSFPKERRRLKRSAQRQRMNRSAQGRLLVLMARRQNSPIP